MTLVHFDLADPAGDPLAGYVGLVPTRRVTVGDEIRLPTALRVRLESGEASVELMPSTTQWVWRVAELVPGGITRYVAVPDTDTVVEYAALESVDPSSLDVSSASVPAWEIATRTAQEMLDRVGEIDGKVERAEDAAAGAESSAGEAESHESAARSSADAAASSARDAASSATAAASSAGSAASSASAAASSASGAASSAGEASGSAEAAASSATAAALSASDAAAHAESAGSSADAAAVSATAAASSATAAAGSVSTAASNATSAAQSATAAAKSAAEAAGSASTAEAHAAEAASSADAASSDASAAASSADAASSSASDAASSARDAQSAVDGFGLDIGMVSTVDAGGMAQASVSKDGSRYTLDLALPRGDRGEGLRVSHVAADAGSLPSSGNATGDLALVSGVMYAWDGSAWQAQGTPGYAGRDAPVVWTGSVDPASAGDADVRDGDLWLVNPATVGEITGDTDNLNTFYTYWEGEADNSPSVLVNVWQVATDLRVRRYGAWWSVIWRVGSDLEPGRNVTEETTPATSPTTDPAVQRLEARVMALEAQLNTNDKEA